MLTGNYSRVALSGAAAIAAVVVTLAADGKNIPTPQASALAAPQTCWSENFDGVVAPALPPGWTSVKLAGTANPWTTSAAKADTAPNEAATGNPTSISDNYLLSPTITVSPAASTLSFRHSHNTESGFDGGVLEISINGGPFADIVTAGGSFTAGGYNATISASLGNPIGTRQGWTGNSGGFITTTVTLPAAALTKNIRLRWRMGTDASTGGSGWSIDSATIQADPCGNETSPGVFSKVVPEDAATAQPFSLTLVWAQSAGAVSYEYCIFTGNAGQCDIAGPNWISTGTGTSVTIDTLAPSTQYWWQVRSMSAGGITYGNGGAGTWPSGFWRFNTQPLPPGAFSRISPLSGATNRFTTLTAAWGGSAGATSYEYCIDTTDDDACGTGWVSRGSNTSVVFTPLSLSPSTTYSWHVRSINSGGTTYADGNPSGFITFTTAPASRVPLLDLDGDGTGDVLIQDLPTGQWSWEKYQAGGFIENVNSTGNQGVQVYSQAMRFDSDARTDVTRFNPDTGEKQLWTNNGVTFVKTGNPSMWWPGWQRTVRDLDGDGSSDFFLHDPATGVWFQCVPTGCYQGGWNPGWETYPMRLNHDSIDDLFLINRQTGRWFWALGTGSGTFSFTYPVTETWFPGWTIKPGDFNGDSLTDLLLHDPGTGTYFVAFTTASGFTYVQGGWSLGWMPIVADMDGDGKDDIFRHDPTTGNWTPGISDGAGGFTKVGFGTWSLGWQIHPTDFDGDGKADFLLYDPQTGVWYQARTNGPGTFAYTSGTWKTGLTISTGAIGRCC